MPNYDVVTDRVAERVEQTKGRVTTERLFRADRDTSFLGRPRRLSHFLGVERCAHRSPQQSLPRRVVSQKLAPEQCLVITVRSQYPVRSTYGTGICEGVDGQARPRPSGRRPHRGRHPCGADLPRQEIRRHHRGPGLHAALEYARNGDVIVVHTLDRLGRTVRDTLNLIHDLAERGVGVRNLADPIRVDSTNPDDPMAQLAVVLLALFGQMERTYMMERAAHARSVATAKGRRVGRPIMVDAAKLEYATHLRDAGHAIAEIVTKGVR